MKPKFLLIATTFKAWAPPSLTYPQAEVICESIEETMDELLEILKNKYSMLDWSNT